MRAPCVPLLLAFVVCSCGPTLPSLDDPCRFPSPVERLGEDAYGVRAGPIWFVGFRSDQTSAVVKLDQVDSPTKFVLQSESALASDLHVHGRNCASGTTLRFNYPFALASDGSMVVPKSGTRIAEPGYMYLTAGRWRIEVQVADTGVGHAVFDAAKP